MQQKCFLVPFPAAEQSVLNAIRVAPCIYSFEGCHAVIETPIASPDDVATVIGDGASVQGGVVVFRSDFDDGRLAIALVRLIRDLDTPIFPSRFIWAWGTSAELHAAEEVLGPPVSISDWE